MLLTSNFPTKSRYLQTTPKTPRRSLGALEFIFTYTYFPLNPHIEFFPPLHHSKDPPWKTNHLSTHIPTYPFVRMGKWSFQGLPLER